MGRASCSAQEWSLETAGDSRHLRWMVQWQAWQCLDPAVLGAFSATAVFYGVEGSRATPSGA